MGARGATRTTTKAGKRATAGPRAVAMAEPPPASAFLGKALTKRWKRLRRQLRRGLPHGRARIDKSVHDMRTAARKVLSVLAAAEPAGPRQSVRRFRRGVRRVLDRLGAVRDRTVQRELLADLTSTPRTPTVRAFADSVDREFARSARKARRRLARIDWKSLHDDFRRIRRRVRDTEKARVTRRDVVAAVAQTFSELQERRAEVDPTAPESVHRMRIGLKQFRYLVASTAPLVPGASSQALDALHTLQTTMGDLHDLEVLSAALAAYAKDDARLTAQVSATLAELEERHSALLRSFLKSADAVLARWNRTLRVSPVLRRA